VAIRCREQVAGLRRAWLLGHDLGDAVPDPNERDAAVDLHGNATEGAVRQECKQAEHHQNPGDLQRCGCLWRVIEW